MTVRPDAVAARSFLSRPLLAAGARFERRGDAVHAADIPGGTARILENLGVVDLSPVPRIGFKGRGTIAAMRAAGIEVEARPNTAFRQPDGSLCAVLAPTEVLILAAPGSEGKAVQSLERGWSLDSANGTYLVPRASTHVWLRVTGGASAALFARICGIDFRPHRFADLEIAQTSVAKLTGIVIREDIGATLAFHLLADSASAEYVWSSLIDAMEEFGGMPAGLTALLELASSHGRNRTDTAD